MSDADALDAASDSVSRGPAASSSTSIGNYGQTPHKQTSVPDKPQANMSGVPPEQWARPVKKN